MVVLVYLAEIDTFHAFTSQRWSNWRTGACLASANDKLHDLVFLYRLSSHRRARCVWWVGREIVRKGVKIAAGAERLSPSSTLRPILKESGESKSFGDQQALEVFFPNPNIQLSRSWAARSALSRR